MLARNETIFKWALYAGATAVFFLLQGGVLQRISLWGVIPFVFPILAYAYYPASAICGWGEPYVLGFAALPAGAAFFALCYAFWRFGVRHYKSTGS